ncbi:coiled-coil domain-containing protein 18 [Chrysoperla carnea]|uniref:coiled-coil domain-containing protein 18 n=1 Tax=Chrysoperla carnea TaxID=189513 RepID=UPI001D06AC26|nr:coiled-coil domain-containing protein 18 [Chrysoperla carnea]
MDEERIKDVEAGREMLTAYQKQKSPRSKQQSSSENSQSDFSFSVSVTPPILPEFNNNKEIEPDKDDTDRSISISEIIEGDNLSNSENDRSLNEIEILNVSGDDKKTELQNVQNLFNTASSEAMKSEPCSLVSKDLNCSPRKLSKSLNSTIVIEDIITDNMTEKQNKIQDVLDEILKKDDCFDNLLINDFESITLEQSFSKIKDLQELLSNKDDIIRTLTIELETLRTQFENFSTLSSNTTTTEYKALAEEYLLKRDTELIRRELEEAKKVEIKKIKNDYEDRVEDIMKNNDSILHTLEEKYVEQIDSLKNEVASLKADIDTKNQSASASTSEEELAEVVLSYERRLHDQVELAKHDLYAALEFQIQKLLDNNGEEVTDCPNEFLQLQQHAMEIAKLKEEHERFIVRSVERQNRRSKTDLELETETASIKGEIHNLKDMNNLQRQIIKELIQYFSKCEDELNNIVIDEILKETFGNAEMSKYNEPTQNMDDSLENISPCDSLNESQLTKFKKVHFTPNISNIITMLDADGLLPNYENMNELSFEIQNELESCLKRLKNEAVELLTLTMNHKSNRLSSNTSILNETNEKNEDTSIAENQNIVKPQIIPHTNKDLEEQINESKKIINNLQLEKTTLETQLTEMIEKQAKLIDDLERAKRKIHELVSENHQKEIVSEGYGESHVSTLPPLESPRESFSQAVELARNVLGEDGEGTDHTEMLAIIESLCRAGLRAMEDSRKEIHDLQLQVILQIIQSICAQKVDSADKKLRDTVQFLEVQANEREMERDETQRELTELKVQLAQRERECAATHHIAQECVNKDIIQNIEQLEQKMRDMTTLMEDSEAKKQETEKELKEAVDKVWLLRDIIRDLESQLEVKVQTELQLQNEIEELQKVVKQEHKNKEELALELHSMKSLPDSQQLLDHADHLEKELAEFKSFGTIESLHQMQEQIEEIEQLVYKRTKDLEFLHAFVSPTSCSSPSEDISATDIVRKDKKPNQISCEPLESARRLKNALEKYTRAESAAVKRIKDLEMQISNINQKYQDLQVERDVLQDRLSDQLTEISTLQMRLDEQRHLVQTITKESNKSLENELFELKNQNHENAILKHKLEKETKSIKALPELMDTLLADKNSEVDLLKSQLDEKEKLIQQLSQSFKDHSDGKNSARTLSDIVSISEFDEAADMLRKDDNTLAHSIHSLDHLFKPNTTEDITHGFPNNLLISDIPPQDIEDLSNHSTKSSSEKRVHFSEQNIIANLKEEILQLRTDLATKISEQNQIIENDLIMKTQQLEMSLISKQKELDDFKVMLQDLEIKYEAKVNELEQVNTELKTIKEQLETEKEHSLKFSKNLENKIVQCDSLTEDVSSLKEHIQSLQTTIGQHETALQKQNEEIQTNLIKIKQLEEKLIDRECEIEILNEDANKYHEDISSLQVQVRDNQTVCDQLNKNIKEKDVYLLKKDNEINELQKEIVHLQDYLKEKDKIIHQVTEDSNTLKISLEAIQKKLKETGNVIDSMQKLKEEQRVSAQLREEIELLKSEINRLEDVNPRTQEFIEWEDITGQVQQELDYSAQLDSNILNAIENRKIGTSSQSSTPKKERLQKVTNFNIEVPPLNTQSEEYEKLKSEYLKLQTDNVNLTEHLKNVKCCNQELLVLKDSLIEELDEIRKQLVGEKDNCVRLQKLLEEEKTNSNDIQIQDANIIEQMRLRLETALDNEIELDKAIENEKNMRGELEERLKEVQDRLESALTSTIMQENVYKTDNEKLSNLTIELQNKCEELKILVAQKDEEIAELRTKINDIKQSYDKTISTLENEISSWKAKFNSMIQDFNELKKDKTDSIAIENMHKLDQVVAENVKLKIERAEYKNRISELVNQLGKSNEMAKLKEQEWKDLKKDNETQAKLSTESKRSKFDLKDYAKHMAELEQENKLVSLQVEELKKDLQLQRELEKRLTDLLAREREEQLKSPVPAKFLEKLNDLKSVLDTHVEENKQMTETLNKLTEERQMLQQRIKQLESQQTKMDVEFNILFGKYLRVESFRKALAWQKQYLLAIVYSYETGKPSCLVLPTSSHQQRTPSSRRKSFKLIATVVLCIFRMKFMVRRWSTGVRLNSRAWGRQNNIGFGGTTANKTENVPVINMPYHHFGQGDATSNIPFIPHNVPMFAVAENRTPIRTPTRLPTNMPKWSGDTPPQRDLTKHTIPSHNFPHSSSVQAPLFSQYMQRFDQIQQRLGLGLSQGLPPP